MISKFLFIAFFSILVSSNCYALTITQGSTHYELTNKDFQEIRLTDIEIEDPVYNKHKRYAGYLLSDIFKAAKMFPDERTMLVFTALDGYKAKIASADVTRTKAIAFVAVKDLDAPDGWEKIQQGKEWVSPAPYYLVWQIPQDAPTHIKLPWPYQIAEILIEQTDTATEKLLPDSKDKTGPIKRGYAVFQQNCIACHSLNLEGGVVGSELNVPKNILEYQDRKFVKAFIEDPSSFRARNKMPGFKDALSPQALNDLLDYLEWIGKHKL